ncbi:MAG: ABC transporter substrate-binding protein [Acetobacteraceae bacterium]|nr:ABC transporter substrate-binding protein [Acetobacteraceae bacterium]
MRLLAAAMLATLPLAATITGAAAQNLTLGTKLELPTLDPHFFNGFPTNSSLSQIFDALADRDATLKLQPALATSWRLVDPLTWEFTLKEGVRFHDGTPFGVADIVATIRRVPNVPNSPALYSPFTRPIRDVAMTDAHRLRISTHEPTPLLPEMLANVMIISARFENASTQDFNDGSAAVGTGPYRLAEWQRGVRLVLARNEAHHRGPPAWAQVTERVLARDSARVAALLAGEVDAIDLVPVADKARIAADPRFVMSSGPAGVVQYIAFDTARAESPFAAGPDGSNPLRDVRVRKALSLAIDRRTLTERLMDRSAEPASQYLPASFDGTSPRLSPDPYEPERARALLAEAGYPNGFRLTLHATNDRYPFDARVAQALGQYWTRIGVQVEVQAVPGTVFFAAATRQEYSAYIAQYGTSGPEEAPRQLVHTYDAARGMGAANRMRHSNPALDPVIEAPLVEMDAARRRVLVYASIDGAIAEYAYVPVFHPTWEFAARRGLVVTSYPPRRFNALMVRPAN